MQNFFILLLFSAGGGASNTELKTTDPVPSTYLYNKFQFGTLWQVYLPAMTYDLVYSGIYSKRSSTDSTHRTLHGVASNIPWIIADRHPCRNNSAVITGVRLRGQTFFQLEYFSPHFLTNHDRICGLFHVTYIPGSAQDATGPLSHSAKEPYVLTWDFRSIKSFAINVSLSEFVAPNSYGCEDARVEVKTYSTVRERFCPNRGGESMFGLDLELQLILIYNRQEPFRNHKTGNYFVKISFHYQILDKDFLYSTYRYPRLLRADVGKNYTLHVDANNDVFLKLIDPSISVMEFPNALVYIFSLNIQTYLTPVVFRKNVICNNHNAELIFYDGPPMLFMQPSLPILKRWGCTQISNDIDSEVRGSLGTLSFAASVPTNDKNESFYLQLTWQAQRMLSSNFRLRTIELDLSKNKTIHLIPRNSTAYEVLKIVAPKGKFVRLWFSDIKYVLFTRNPRYGSMCYTGIYINDPLNMHLRQELICSNSTAEHIVNYCKERSLTVGQVVTITLVQFWLVGRVSVMLTVSTDDCAGYINLLYPPEKEFTVLTTRLPGGIVRAEPVYVDNIADRNRIRYDVNIRIWFKRFPGVCAKLQLVHFQDLSHYTFTLHMRVAVVQYIITSQDLTSTSRFLIDLSSVGKGIQFRNISSTHTLHLFSLENTLTQQESLHSGTWDAEAYVTQIRIHTSLLTHAAGLAVQVEDGRMPPECMIEHGKNLPTFRHLDLSGSCAYAELHLREAFHVFIHKPYHSRHCCRLEATVDHRQETQGWFDLSVLRTQTAATALEMWDISGGTNGLKAKVNVICGHHCEGIKFSIYPLNDFTHRTKLIYRASLIERSNVRYESFEQSEDWGQICLKHVCYIVPLLPMITSWNNAKEECERMNASLLSINSDSEWTMLAAIIRGARENLISFKEIYIYYIGLLIEVSKHGKINTNVGN